jgi:hypothetical protein
MVGFAAPQWEWRDRRKHNTAADGRGAELLNNLYWCLSFYDLTNLIEETRRFRGTLYDKLQYCLKSPFKYTPSFEGFIAALRLPLSTAPLQSDVLEME